MHLFRQTTRAAGTEASLRRRTLFAVLGALLVVTGCAASDDVGEAAPVPTVDTDVDDGSAPGVENDDAADADGEPADDPEGADDAEVGGEAEVTDEPQPEADPGPTGPPVTIAFGGDVMFEGMIAPQLEADPDGLLDPIAPVFAEADLVVVNLETAITEGGDPAPKSFTFRAPPTALQALKAAGVDVASLANNHGMDFGQSGLEDTFAAAADHDFPLIGAGRDIDEAFAPYTATIRGRDIAVIGATQVMDTAFFDSWPATAERPGLAFAKHEHEADLIDAVTSAREVADTVVVYLHWGVEGEECPSERQTGLAERLADAGADIVVGTHAHRLQGTGMLGDTLIDYGLGNFVFYSQQPPGTVTGVLMVTVEGSEIVDYEWVPARIREGIPHPLDGDEVTVAVADWEELRSCTNLSDR